MSQETKPNSAPTRTRRRGKPLDVEWVEPTGEVLRQPLELARTVDFENAMPVRQPSVYRDQKHMPNVYWCATTGRSVTCESRRELEVVRLLDFSPDVVGLATQPFRVRGKGVRNGRVPDIFVRRNDGSGVVFDVKTVKGAASEPFEAASKYMQKVCDAAGWSYRVNTHLDRTLLKNIQWLAYYRRPAIQSLADEHSETLKEACRDGASIAKLETAGILNAMNKPALFALAWRGTLHFDVLAPLRLDTIFTTRGGSGR